MAPSDEIIRTIHLPQFGVDLKSKWTHFDLKNKYQILLNIAKKICF